MNIPALIQAEAARLGRQLTYQEVAALVARARAEEEPQ